MARSSEEAVTRRRQWVADIVRERSSVRVSDLSQMTGVSTVTIREDLRSLEHHGALRRVHGGARSLDEATTTRPEYDWVPANAARTVAAFARSGDRIVLGPGPGLGAVAAALIHRAELTGITIRTESLDLARHFAGLEHRFTVVVPAGRVSARLTVEPDGELDLLAADGEKFELGVVECHGISAAGLHADSDRHAARLRRTAFAARRTIALVPPRAFSHHPERVACSLDYVDACVTPLPLEQDLCDQFRAAGVEIFAAG